jgi:DUF1680 family protein
VVADYTISAYFRAADGVYVNLFVPSRLTWTEGAVRYRLTQETAYPAENLATLKLTLTAPAEFALHLRVPAWAGKQTSISVNGRRLREAPAPATFFAIRRTWKDGDHIEFDLDQGVATQAVDAQTPDQVAIVRGPQVLFAIAERQPVLARERVANPQLSRAAGHDWILPTGEGTVLLRPFADIRAETYQTYWKVAG